MRLGPKLSKGKLLDTQCLRFINSKALAPAYEARDELPRCVTLASIGVANLWRRTNIEPIHEPPTSARGPSLITAMWHIAVPVAEAVDSLRSSQFAPTMFSPASQKTAT